jgi:hypothetical protein
MRGRCYLAQIKMLTVDERTQEAAKINKALGIGGNDRLQRSNIRSKLHYFWPSSALE